jgi:DNA polymerase
MNWQKELSMNQSEFEKLAKNIKNLIDEEKMWGEAELMLQRSKDRLKGKSEGSTAPASRVSLDEFRASICSCTKCPLGKTRLNFVFGTGNPHARVIFVGEGPGFDEDHKGEPFVGRAGELLNKIIESIGLKREEVYIANTVKCHPMVDPTNPEKRGNDRPPSPEEIQSCLPYLEQQIALIQPQFICTLGNWAAHALLKVETGISKLRGRFYEYGAIRLMPTYHPAALLRNPDLKKDVWEDMKMLKAALAQQK